MSARYTNQSEIEAVVRSFENCTTDKDEFKHADHLTVAVWYLQTLSIDEAVKTMRASLWRFLDHHGVDRQKYHETLTVFWIEITAKTMKQYSNTASVVDGCNYILSELADKDLVNQFYSRELLVSDQAREGFVEPDLRNWA